MLRKFLDLFIYANVTRAKPMMHIEREQKSIQHNMPVIQDKIVSGDSYYLNKPQGIHRTKSTGAHINGSRSTLGFFEKIDKALNQSNYVSLGTLLLPRYDGTPSIRNKWKH